MEAFVFLTVAIVIAVLSIPLHRTHAADDTEQLR